jgi:hypothetical protein
MRTWLSAALISVAALTGTASATPPPSPVWWQGTYGNAPFWGRQISDNGSRVDCNEDGLLPLRTLGLGILFNGPTFCSDASASPANHHGGDMLLELATCITPESDHVDWSGEVSFDIVDNVTHETVRHWDSGQSASYAYTLHGGQCAFQLWNLAMVTDAGVPFTSGREYVALFQWDEGETHNPTFVAP